jgi:hypothetical protein
MDEPHQGARQISSVHSGSHQQFGKFILSAPRVCCCGVDPALLDMDGFRQELQRPNRHTGRHPSFCLARTPRESDSLPEPKRPLAVRCSLCWKGLRCARQAFPFCSLVLCIHVCDMYSMYLFMYFKLMLQCLVLHIPRKYCAMLDILGQ